MGLKFKKANESVGWLGNYGNQVIINEDERKKAEDDKNLKSSQTNPEAAKCKEEKHSGQTKD
jgi:hypothetical protein